MEYYGCINRDDFNALSKEEQQTLLYKKGLFSVYLEMPIPLTTGEQRIRKDLSELEKYLESSSELRESLYAFILQHYQNHIRGPFYLFFDRFHFEDDLYFSAMGILREKYGHYRDIFISFDAFVFTYTHLFSNQLFFGRSLRYATVGLSAVSPDRSGGCRYNP